MGAKFSVGRLKFGDTTLAKCTGITVRTDGNNVDLYAGGFKDPHQIQIGNRSVTVSVDFAEWSGDYEPDDVLTNEYVTVELLASNADAERGLSGLSLDNCKAISWEAAATQDGFVTYRMEFRLARNS